MPQLRIKQTPGARGMRAAGVCIICGRQALAYSSDVVPSVGTFCDIVAVDGRTTPDMAMHYQRLSKDRQRAFADKVAASITTPQRDVTVSAESDKDKEIARLRARLAELEAGE